MQSLSTEENPSNSLLFSLELVVQTLNKENRKRLVETFANELRSLGYTKQYISMIRNGSRTLGNDALIRLLVNSPNALNMAIELVKEQINELENAITTLKNADLTPLKKEYGPKGDQNE